MTCRTAILVSVALSSIALASCGVIFAPIEFGKAVASNSNYVFKGTVVDPAGKPVDGVVAVQTSEHRVWAPLEGTVYNHNEVYTRVDGQFLFAIRGTELKITFSKEGYRDAVYDFSADANKDVSTNMGDWHTSPNFSVLLIPVNARDAYLAHQSVRVSYEHYPIADTISLPNLLTEGASGDIVYKDKDATDLTVLPDGTLYAVVDSTPPKALDQFGKIDPADLDIPNSVTLRIAGTNTGGVGFIRMVPQPGLHPMLASILAPESGYTPELSLSRERLKEMRLAGNNAIDAAHEYFYFKVGDRFGKGVLTWANSRGKPEFTFNLYYQRRAATRDLTTFNYEK